MSPAARLSRARLAIVGAGLLAVGGCRERQLGPDEGAPAGTSATAAAGAAPTPARVLYPSAPGSFVDLVASARHGVVTIRAAAPVKSGPAAMFPGAPEASSDLALGTGFLIEANGVFILTTDQVAAASERLTVVLADGVEAPATLVGRDPRLDVALLSIDTPRLRPLRMGDSDDLQVGEWLVVLGNPFGAEVSAAVGIVSATGRDPGSLVPGRTMGFRTFVQTDARIHRGNSGGPVIDTAGEVVGIALATGDRPTELSFVIPINRVREVVDALRDHGQVQRSWLGVLVKPVTAELAATLGLPQRAGALVTELKAGSPAARAGLRPGDVILRWGERAVDDRALPWIVAATPVGRPITVTVWRNRAELPVTVLTEKMPE